MYEHQKLDRMSDSLIRGYVKFQRLCGRHWRDKTDYSGFLFAVEDNTIILVGRSPECKIYKLKLPKTNIPTNVKFWYECGIRDAMNVICEWLSHEYHKEQVDNGTP